MTAAATRPDGTCYRNRETVDGRPWWIPDESPGVLGSPELWIDEGALDAYGRGDAAPAVTVTRASPASWFDAIVRFSAYPGLDAPAVYTVISRQTSPANLTRPYYVLRWPD